MGLGVVTICEICESSLNCMFTAGETNAVGPDTTNDAENKALC